MNSRTLAASILCLASLAMSFGASPDRYTPRFGSATVAPPPKPLMPYWYATISLPVETHDVTVSGWLATQKDQEQPTASYLPSPQAWWCPNNNDRGPDVLDGRGGWGTGGTILAGSVVVPWSCTNSADYCPDPSTASANPWGAYTLCGRSANPVTVTLGSVDVTFPGGNVYTNFNAVGGPGSAIILSGVGRCEIGIRQMYWNEFFWHVDGVVETATMQLTAETTVSNEYVFVAQRFHLGEDGHRYQVNLWHWDGADNISQAREETMPVDGSTIFGPRTFMRIGLLGIGRIDHLTVRPFDFRVSHEWVSDDDLVSIYDDGRRELDARGIGRYLDPLVPTPPWLN